MANWCSTISVVYIAWLTSNFVRFDDILKIIPFCCVAESIFLYLALDEPTRPREAGIPHTRMSAAPMAGFLLDRMPVNRLQCLE
jgi:hypothetical protein